MLKIFSPLNIFTIIVLLGVTYLSYDHFKEASSESRSQLDDSKIESSSEGQEEVDLSKEQIEVKSLEQDQKNVTPKPKIIQDRDQARIPEEVVEANSKKEQESSQGFYENQAYNYQVHFPKNWPLRINSQEKITLGYIFVENGIGSFVIEVGQNNPKELEEAKKQAQTQPGITLEEETIRVDGVLATKYIINNSFSDSENINILISKNNHDYLIKYSNHSLEFVEQAEQIVDNFKFIP